MPPKPLLPCRKPGCRELLRGGGFCVKHQKEKQVRQDRNRESSSKRGYDRRWQKIRTAALVRDDYACVQCGKPGKTDEPLEVDHILPKSMGGTDDLDNLQSLCKSCHSAKTMRESVSR